MNREALVYAVSGLLFGLLVGWVIGSQRGPVRSFGVTPPAAATAPAAQPQAPPPLDQTRVQALESAAAGSPTDPRPRIELGNLLFDAERYADAIRWYEEALKLDPKNPNLSTDLGVSYYYTNQPDRALQQFDVSLAIDPVHTKTLLNRGIVRAFGKQDLKGAIESWEEIVRLAPESPEGRAAKQALDNMKAAHPDVGAVTDK